MLKFFRVFAALSVFVCLSALFLDFTETVPSSVHRLAHLQIVPLLKSQMMLGLLLWLVLTLLFGRIYCSVLCPLGILQDMISRAAKAVRRKKMKYKFRAEMYKTRRFFLLLFLVGLAAMPVLVSLLDPYSNYGRLMTLLVYPFYLMGNNFLALSIPSVFSDKAVHLFWFPAAFAFAVTLFAAVLSFFFGRRYCNTICPVGTLLGLFAKISPFRIRLNSNCVSCGLCEKVCKGECIDTKAKTVDVSRCVDCFNCLRVCKKKGIAFGGRHKGTIPLHVDAKETNVSPPLPDGTAAAVAPRRSFLRGLTVSLLFGSTVRAAAQSAAQSSGLPTGQSRVSYKKTQPILPPGANDKEHLIHHCTACQLCVAKCPSNVLKPSLTDLGVRGFLVPVATFERGFCNYHCTICAEVCPTAALTPMPVEEKYKLQIGRVVFLEENCVVHTQETNCGACAEHCPTGAVTMIPYGPPGSALTIPKLDADLCVGCGACENICPVTPYRAIYVDGLEKHGEAKPAFDPTEKQKEVQLDSFGF